MAKRFHKDYPAHLFATELPFHRLSGLVRHGAYCLAVASTGDVPLWLFRLGAGRVVGVDVSLNSLALAEIKRAAAQELGFEEFLTFFLAGSPWARSLFQSARIDPDFDRKRWLEIAQRLYTVLSKRGTRYLKGLDPCRGNPFLESLRPTDLAVLGGIPFLREPKQFYALKESAREYPLVPGSIEAYLARTRSLFDLIYLSNLPEYMLSLSLLADDEAGLPERMARLHTLAARRLTSRGVVASYHFHSPEKRPRCCQLAHEVLSGLGLKVRILEVQYTRDAPLKASFTHLLLVASTGFQEAP